MSQPKSLEPTERLEARVPLEVKKLLRRAADLQGRSLSDFVVHAASEAAATAIEKHQVLTLTAKEQAHFVEVLLDPPKPGPNLRNAVRRYKKEMGR